MLCWENYEQIIKQSIITREAALFKNKQKTQRSSYKDVKKSQESWKRSINTETCAFKNLRISRTTYNGQYFTEFNTI